jgi:hypothetical protein
MNPRISIYRYALCLALLAPSAAWGSHPLITDDAGTQGQGNFQLEVSGQADHDRAGGRTTTGGQLATSLSYGLIDPVDLIVTIPYLWIEHENGLSDVNMDVKFRFFEKDGFSFAVKPGLSLPTGDDDKGLGAGKVGGHLYLIGMKEAGPMTFIANVGYIRYETDVDGAEKDIWHASIAGVYSLNDHWKLAADIVAERNTSKEADNDPVSAVVGVIYSPTKNIDLDLGVKRGITSSATDWSLMAGTTFRF